MAVILKFLGFFHLLHSPILIIFPYIIQHYTTDILYIIYFLLIMFSYTFIDGECPISYISKKIHNNEYISGQEISRYPEMEYFIHKSQIDYYFGITTTAYIGTLFYVIFRSKMANPFLCLFTFCVLLNYFLQIRGYFPIRYLCIIRELTKYTLLFAICFFFNVVENHIKISSLLYIYGLCCINAVNRR